MPRGWGWGDGFAWYSPLCVVGDKGLMVDRRPDALVSSAFATHATISTWALPCAHSGTYPPNFRGFSQKTYLSLQHTYVLNAVKNAWGRMVIGLSLLNASIAPHHFACAPSSALAWMSPQNKSFPDPAKNDTEALPSLRARASTFSYDTRNNGGLDSDGQVPKGDVSPTESSRIGKRNSIWRSSSFISSSDGHGSSKVEGIARYTTVTVLLSCGFSTMTPNVSPVMWGWGSIVREALVGTPRCFS